MKKTLPSDVYERFKKAHAEAHEKSIRLVFHGTDPNNIQKIAREGLDPKRRRGQALSLIHI